MRTDFKNIAIDQLFHGEKSYGMGCYSHELNYTIYKKINKSSAMIIEDVNYHNNNRRAGQIEKFAPFKSVYAITEEVK
jgi:hypothetical protein